jgi:hypothetical protein
LVQPWIRISGAPVLQGGRQDGDPVAETLEVGQRCITVEEK